MGLGSIPTTPPHTLSRTGSCKKAGIYSGERLRWVGYLNLVETIEYNLILTILSIKLSYTC